MKLGNQTNFEILDIKIVEPKLNTCLESNLSLIASMVFSTIGWQTEASELTTKFSS